MLEKDAMRWRAWTKILPSLLLGFAATTPVSAEGWGWIPANPPVTLPDLISKGGQVEGWLAGRASTFIPYVDEKSDYSAAGYLVSYDRKLYRCVTQDSKSMDDGNCFVAVNE